MAPHPQALPECGSPPQPLENATVTILCHCRSCRGKKHLSRRSVERHVRVYGRQGGHPRPQQVKTSTPGSSPSSATDPQPSPDESASVIPPQQQQQQAQQAQRAPVDKGQARTNTGSHPREGTSSADPELQFSPELLKPIYEGCKLTLVDIILMVMDLYSTHPGMSQSAVSSVLQLMGKLLPDDHILPASFRQAKSMLNSYLCPELRIDMCSHGHILYYGSSADLQECPTCGEPRSSTSQYVYLPLIPRLRKMMAVPHTAKMLDSTGSSSEGTTMDVQDAPIWKKHMEMEQEQRDVVRVALAASIDGFCPFNVQKNTYSMTPVLLSILNAPPCDRNKSSKSSHILLSSIIPGPSAPSDLNLYLAPLVDELKELEEGVTALDHSGQTVKLKARLIMGVYDNPGIAKVLKSAGVNAVSGACRHCEQQGTYTAGLSKVLYIANRRFLPSGHSLRREKRGFSDVGEEKRHPPAKRRRTDQLEAGRKIALLQAQGRNTSRLEKESGQKGLEEFARLPYFHEVAHPVEPMHTIQVVMKKFLGLLTGKDLTPKLLSFESRRRNDGELRTLWTLSSNDKNVADGRLAEVSVPHGYPWAPRGIFKKMGYMKSAEILHLSTDGILKYALRGLLPEAQRNSFFKLLTCLQKLCSPIVGELDKLREDLNEALALLERDWPLSIQTLCTHLLHHIVDSVEECGPVQSFWMFPFERMLGFLGKRIQNRKDPEITAVETYRVYELSRMWNSASSSRGKLDESPTDQSTATNVNPYRNFFSAEGYGRAQADSSCVAVRDLPYPRFGRIKSFREGKAAVSWYSKTELDESSGLYFVNLTAPRCGTTLIPIPVLPPPVVTASDGNRIWFLDVKEEFLP